MEAEEKRKLTRRGSRRDEEAEEKRKLRRRGS